MPRMSPGPSPSLLPLLSYLPAQPGPGHACGRPASSLALPYPRRRFSALCTTPFSCVGPCTTSKKPCRTPTLLVAVGLSLGSPLSLRCTRAVLPLRHPSAYRLRSNSLAVLPLVWHLRGWLRCLPGQCWRW